MKKNTCAILLDPRVSIIDILVSAALPQGDKNKNIDMTHELQNWQFDDVKDQLSRPKNHIGFESILL